MNAWADGLNFYLAKHPAREAARHHALRAVDGADASREGSIGGDIEKVNLSQLQAFYGKAPASEPRTPRLAPVPMADEPRGSNGMAIAPSNTTAHHALLLINPHTSFFFRSELQMTSDEGLNAYGASTWGQFFIYQGFNEHVGWMHTSSARRRRPTSISRPSTKKGDQLRLQVRHRGAAGRDATITVPYKTDAGMAQKTFTVYRTHARPDRPRGRTASGSPFALMKEPVKALTQSYTRTKAKDYKSFQQTMELHTNSSNNTIFADADGDIAYFHGNFIPKRDPSFDWTQPVDGSDPATDWNGLLSVDETPHLLNPASGWLYNSNNWPWSAAGPSSPKQADYPAYVDTGGESARGLHAVRVLAEQEGLHARRRSSRPPTTAI